MTKTIVFTIVMVKPNNNNNNNNTVNYSGETEWPAGGRTAIII